MLAEALLWLLTPASREARRFGHLAEAIAITARERRCRAAWGPHLARTRAALLASARTCRRRRRALLLGSGPLLDVPLVELAGLFEEVWLLDMVHPWAARRAARRLGNVRLLDYDAGGGLAALLARGCPPAAPPLPAPLPDDGRLDWLASINLLSQLPLLPLRWLESHCPAMDAAARAAYGEALIRAHLDSLAATPAQVCLIADRRQELRGADGGLLESRDYAACLGTGWRCLDEWDWEVAPPGELAGGLTARHRVMALQREGPAAGQGDP